MRTQKKILILGAAGLIGSACARYFEKQENISLFLPSHAELELTNANLVNQYFQQHQPDVVILAAGKVGGILANKTYTADFITENLLIELNVFRATLKTHVKKLVFFGSSCMYPKQCVQPMKEEMLLTGVIEPSSASYAMAKLAGLQMCRAYNEQFQRTQFITLIPNSTYGFYDNFDLESAHVLSALIRKIHEAKQKKAKKIVLWGTGDPRREFIYSDDVAEAVDLVLQQETVPLPLNIGIGRDYSIKELANTIGEVVDFKGEIIWDTSQPDGASRKLLDNTKILSLGWEPKTDLILGIQKTYQWFLSNKIELVTNG